MSTAIDLIPPDSRALPEYQITWLIEVLGDGEWHTAEEILQATRCPVTETSKRRIRALAAGSSGRIAGGQAGYKLVTEMTAAEFAQIDGWMSSQEREMKIRRLEYHNVFHAATRTRK